MIPMNARNKAALKEYINSPTDVGFFGGTNFEAAFTKAFDALDETSTSDCQKVLTVFPFCQQCAALAPAGCSRRISMAPY